MAEILKGAAVAAALSEALTGRVEQLRSAGIIPTLAIVRVGENESDLSYERGAEKRCAKVGVEVRNFTLPPDCTQSELLEVIRQINGDRSIHGCLLFRPLPKQLDERAMCEALSPEKDVDCITGGSLCSVFTGEKRGYPPCTAQACLEILDHYGYELRGKRVTVIGRSLVVGKPVSMMLQSRNATVTMCHTKTVDMPAVCREAELLVVAAGKAGMVDETLVSPGQVVIDVGINVDGAGRLCGDVAFDRVEPVVAAITPVPGGVGAVTTAVLAKHVVEAAEQQRQAVC